MKVKRETIEIEPDVSQLAAAWSVAKSLYSSTLGFALPYPAVRTEEEGNVLDRVANLLDSVGEGDSVIVRPPHGFIPVNDEAKILGVSRTGLVHWLQVRGVEEFRANREVFIRAKDFERLRDWRISLVLPRRRTPW